MLYVAGLGLLAMAQGLIGVMLGAGVLIGMALACTASAIAMAVGSRAVPGRLAQHRAGAVTATGSLGALIAAPLGQMLSDDYGWRAGRAGLPRAGAAHAPRRLDRRPGRQGAACRPPAAETSAPLMAGLAAACATRPFLVMSAAYFVCGMQLVFLTTHLPSYLRSAAWTRC